MLAVTQPVKCPIRAHLKADGDAEVALKAKAAFPRPVAERSRSKGSNGINGSMGTKKRNCEIVLVTCGIFQNNLNM